MKFSLKGDYTEVQWFVIPKRVGFISKDGVFSAVRPGKCVVVARVKLKDGRVTSVKAFAKVLNRP